ncbi:STAS/SEC14 domain-containing protein [Hymenobacter jejuensis]|uniref:STAS/SEC14 domain-containing protein n=1 Tax=Hymenobacter jejuensis TaxID=2502781 RepID=A0A5B7ZYH4_9BACT|nr:STAS/SEC14 domain-containing protein [Hymenobacter jejuensis]QDA60244.1 hypothetical protein FHG12_09020 [Hymenobacter jejuensis]
MKQTTALTLYFENSAGQLLEHPAGFLRATWSERPRQLADTRALFTHMLRALLQRGWSRILIDQRVMLPFSSEEQTWIAQEWLPRAVQEGGYRAGAVVVSADVMTRLATAFVTTQIQNRALVYRSFETEAEATEWLLQQPASPRGE